MDLNSYADLAVRLVNTTNQGRQRGDGLALLREELRAIFTAADRADGAQVAERLNALLTRHPIHQQIVSHDGQHWHIHLVESGSAADRHAAGAIAGLAGLVTESGTDRFGACAAADCERVFIATGPPAEKRYCSEQCKPKANVHALRTHGHGSQGPASTAASLVPGPRIVPNVTVRR